MQRLAIAIEDALVAWMQAICADATILWANQDGHTPEPPFVLLEVIAGPQNIGPAEERYKNADTYSYGFRKRCTLNVQIFAADALLRAGAVANALELPSKQSILQEAGIAVWGSDGPRDLTQLMDTAFEPRAGIDLFISWPDPTDDAPGEIRRVRVTGTVENLTVDRTIDIEA